MAKINVGKGSYSTALQPGQGGVTDFQGADITPLISENITGAVPTNDWWSSLIIPTFGDSASAPMHAHPISLKAELSGLGIGHRSSPTIYEYEGNVVKYEYGYAQQLHIGLAGMQATEVLADDYSDWTATAKWQDANNSLKATFGHGMPFVYFEREGNSDVYISGNTGGIWHHSQNVIGVTIDGVHYGMFAPSGATWTIENGKIVSDLNGKDYFSVAELPDNSLEILNLFHSHAYAFVTDTQISFAYDQDNAQVVTDFTLTTELKESTGGFSADPLITLYRHQSLNSDDVMTDYSYNSARGEMKLMAGSAFTTRADYNGILPSLPNFLTSEQNARLHTLVDSEYQALLNNGVNFASDTYWVGKELGRLGEMEKIADQVGHLQARDFFINAIKVELEDWFTVSDGNSDKQFYYNAQWGTFQGYPASFHSETQINDHHFHYGYFVKGAATVAQYDSQWAADWGGMVDLLIKDVANTERDGVTPFLRNIDPYAGHSWASGHGAFWSGNNHESSSEAMNFATGVIEWGAYTQNTAVRDLGIYLHTTEKTAIEQYWFDIDDAVFPDAFRHSTTGMVWGDGASYATWFSGEPEHIHGINFLPINGGSLYLGHHVDEVRENYQDLVNNNGGNANDWVDLIWQFLSFTDPDAAIDQFEANLGYSRETGESQVHTFHWLYNMQSMGQVDSSITADTPFYAVFNKNGVKTYTAFNPTATETTVSFSDGTSITLASGDFLATDGNRVWSLQSNTSPGTPDDSNDGEAIYGSVNNDHIVTGADDDIVHGLSGDDIINGDDGNDILHGNGGDDILKGGNGNDTLYGNHGANIIIGGAGADNMHTQAGGSNIYTYIDITDSTIQTRDSIYGFVIGSDKIDLTALGVTFGDLVIDTNTGNILVSIKNSNFQIMLQGYVGLSASDFVLLNGTPSGGDDNSPALPSTSNNPPLQGTDAADVMHGTLNDDEINADAGDDEIHGLSGNDAINGDNGNDILHGNEGDDILSGGSGNDVLHGNNGDDTLFGGLGSDVLYGNAGANLITGGAGADNLHTQAGGTNIYSYTNITDSTTQVRDSIYGFDVGSDKIDLKALHVTFDDLSVDKSTGNTLVSIKNTDFQIWLQGDVSLSINNFILLDTSYSHTLQATSGSDDMYATLANDDIIAGAGDDVMRGMLGDDRIKGQEGHDILHGNEGSDVLIGGDGDDVLHGNLGNDRLFGGLGSDKLHGNENDDFIDGGLGADEMAGGAGNDIFSFGSLLDSTVNNKDTIKDFEAGKDSLDFTRLAEYGIIAIDDVTITSDGHNTTISAVDSDFTIELLGVFNLDETDFNWGSCWL